MLQEISYYLIFGKPAIMYLGIATMLSFMATATVGILSMKGNTKIPFKWHPTLAGISLTLAAIHGILGLLLYF